MFALTDMQQLRGASKLRRLHAASSSPEPTSGGVERKGGPGRVPRLVVATMVCGTATFAAASARAQDDVFGPPTATVTETAVFRYHFDNRDSNPLDDEYGEWINRLNAQATSGRFTLSLRVDSAMYFRRPNPNELAREAEARPPVEGEVREPTYFADKRDEYGRALSDRYINTVYPAKYSLRYSTRQIDATAGDYYVQFGKGLVLSLRKFDELAADTTLRGGIVRVTPDLGNLKLEVTALGGASNPLRIDDVSGRQLSQRTSGVAEKLAYPAMPIPNQTPYVAAPQPTFVPDVIIGGQVEGGTKAARLGVRGIQLTRGDADFFQGDSAVASRNASRILMGSVSANVPDIASHGSFYVEAAGQRLQDFGPRANLTVMDRLSHGYGVYALATVFEGPFVVTLEGKHYNHLFPLTVSTDPSATEFSNLQYNVVPTTEPITSDTQLGLFNVCVTGGRARLDYRASSEVILLGSVGRYRSYSENSSFCGEEPGAGADEAPLGKVARIRNDVWDPLVGTEIMFDEGRSHFVATTGVRFDESGAPQQYAEVASPTTVYYREHYVRYMLSKVVWGPWSAEISGFHRYRFEPSRSPDPWREGENYISAVWSPKLTFAVGYEYTTDTGERLDFYNGMVQYRPTTASTIRAFVGQTRPGLRCVSGLCRQFPAFEGAKLEANLTF